MGWIKKWKESRALSKWEAAGRPAPPPHVVKQKNLRDFRDRFGLEILVETGTYKGDMVEAMKGGFRKVYSIELADHFHQAAVRRFQQDAHVEILHGDSGRVMAELVPKLDGPTLFWLDGHYSAGTTARGDKDTPILEELDHIFARKDFHCVVLVDDARCFEGLSEQIYPSIDEVRAFVNERRPGWLVDVETDCIRITPGAA
ncbi:MAG: hypothetical protein EAZ65_02825 [Verrucomicrobia bacterium]|nr:MAG: hypothetical protein EAZ84_02365 [Verrucomicrobiota bacterium]TAE88317.1 MAG: hypothetical protein EAZ82_03510 [Verrucomicrobiota bacterium]TAF26771.1 MAG: hypothetical protein EAZ71_02820 [Verrucomicrobiota bacterium]TAF42027.1 MAG: hypothetical protein EAZ65_02825 [Verrucomicrobiota bacterium]